MFREVAAILTQPDGKSLPFTNTFADGFVTPEFGVLPITPPATELPEEFSILDIAAQNVQVWIKNNDIDSLKEFESQLNSYIGIDNLFEALNDSQLARVKVILGTCGHAYSYLMNKDANDTYRVDEGMPGLFQLWRQVSQLMGQGDTPILSIADAAYYNWRYKDSSTVHSVDQLKHLANIERLVPVFNNNEDDISNLGMIVFEAHFAQAVKAIMIAVNTVKEKTKVQTSVLSAQLDIVMNAMQDITRELLNLFNLHHASDNYIDLEVWTKTYIKFVKRSYPNEPNLAGFADSFFYIIEALLGRQQYSSSLGQEMQHTEALLPKNQLAFIKMIKEANIRKFIEYSNNDSLKRKFQMIHEAYAGSRGFLGVHKGLALCITVLGSQSRPSTNAGNNLNTGIGDQLELSRSERNINGMQNSVVFEIKEQVAIHRDKHGGDTYQVRLELQDDGMEARDLLSFLQPGACVSIPIINSKTTIDEVKKVLSKRGLDELCYKNINISNNQAWLQTRFPWSQSHCVTIEQLLPYADLLTIINKLNRDEDVNLEKDLLPLAERTYSVSSVEGKTLNLIVKRQICNDGRVGLGSSFLTSEINIGVKIICKLLPPVKFTLPKGDEHPILLIASGNGISPFMYFLSQLNQKRAKNPVRLIYITREEDPHWLKEKVMYGLANLKNLQVCIICTGENKRIEWISANTSKPLISKDLNRFAVINSIVKDLKIDPKMFIYICGGVSFTKAALDSIQLEVGNQKFATMIGNSQIVFESFCFTQKFAEIKKQDENKEYTIDEIKQHATLESCWVISENKVYDITSFLNIHTGGRDIFLSAALGNRDISSLYRAVHGNSLSAAGWLSSYHIGYLRQPIRSVGLSETTEREKAFDHEKSHPIGMLPSCPFAAHGVGYLQSTEASAPPHLVCPFMACKEPLLIKNKQPHDEVTSKPIKLCKDKLEGYDKFMLFTATTSSKSVNAVNVYAQKQSKNGKPKAETTEDVPSVMFSSNVCSPCTLI